MMKTVPTNMSVPNCEVNHDFTRAPFPTFRTGVLPITPLPGPAPNMLNEECISNQYAKDFYKVECQGQCPSGPSTYVSNDPRLVDVARGGYFMHLDTPPVDGSIRLKDIYTDPTLQNYGKPVYNGGYSDVKAGQVLYYMDQAVGPPLHEPIFENPAEVRGWLYQDAMGALKPYYCRKPIVYTDVYDTKHYKPGQLTWIRDSLESREDIMALQMDLMNRQKYSARWL